MDDPLTGHPSSTVTDPAGQPVKINYLARGVSVFTNTPKAPAQWQYEVTGDGRIWHLVDHETRTCWIKEAGTGHPKKTD